MVNQTLRTATTKPPLTARRVYCAEEAPLKLADGTPLHLEWIIEGPDGNLYRVPSEPGGWLRRAPYRGELDRMKLVSPENVRTILWLTYADAVDAADADRDVTSPALRRKEGG
jgi:hypothetical protein